MTEHSGETGAAKSEPTGLSDEELEGASGGMDGGGYDDWRCGICGAFHLLDGL